MTNTNEGDDRDIARELEVPLGEEGDRRQEIRPLREEHRGGATRYARPEESPEVLSRERLRRTQYVDADALLLRDLGDGLHR